MNRKIRLVWDFYGEPAQGTADHHVVHLEQFMMRENLAFFSKGTQPTGPDHVMAFITVSEKDIPVLRDALKPNRAFVEKTED